MGEALNKVRGELLAAVAGIFDGARTELVAATVNNCCRITEMRDLTAYVRDARRRGMSDVVIAFNVAHDLFQFDAGDPYFVPRTRGYANKTQHHPKETSHEQHS